MVQRLHYGFVVRMLLLSDKFLTVGNNNSLVVVVYAATLNVVLDAVVRLADFNFLNAEFGSIYYIVRHLRLTVGVDRSYTVVVANCALAVYIACSSNWRFVDAYTVLVDVVAREHDASLRCERMLRRR